MQVENVFAEQQSFVGVVPNQIFNRINFGIAWHQNSAGHGTQLVVNGGVHLFAHALQNAKQVSGLVSIGCGTLACKVPLYKFVVGLSAKEAPRHNAA